MRSRPTLGIVLALMLASAFTAGPTTAQGKARGHDKGKDARPVVHAQQTVNRDRPVLIRRDRGDDRREADRRWDDRYERDGRYERDDRYDSRSGKRSVPPGWCIGRGNPHNTPENCGWRSDRRYNDRRDRDGRWDERGISFEEAHARFHREQERRCRRMAAERPLDIVWQMRVRAECREEHERWHERYGRDRSRD